MLIGNWDGWNNIVLKQLLLPVLLAVTAAQQEESFWLDWLFESYGSCTAVCLLGGVSVGVIVVSVSSLSSTLLLTLLSLWFITNHCPKHFYTTTARTSTCMPPPPPPPRILLPTLLIVTSAPFCVHQETGSMMRILKSFPFNFCQWLVCGVLAYYFSVGRTH